MAIRNIVATGATNDPLAGLQDNFRYTRSQLVFTQGGWLARDDLKRLEAKLQRMVQVPQSLQMAPADGSAEHSAEPLFLKIDGSPSEKNPGKLVIPNY